MRLGYFLLVILYPVCIVSASGQASIEVRQGYADAGGYGPSGSVTNYEGEVFPPAGPHTYSAYYSADGNSAAGIMSISSGGTVTSLLGTGYSHATGPTDEDHAAGGGGNFYAWIYGGKHYVITGSYKGLAEVGGHGWVGQQTGGSEPDFGIVNARGATSGSFAVWHGATTLVDDTIYGGGIERSWASNAQVIFSLYDPVGFPELGDVSSDGVINDLDIMLTQGHLGQIVQESLQDYDLDGDGVITDADVDIILAAIGTVRGDANLDGRVDIADFNKLSANMGQAGIWGTGDFNRDGIVNMQDFNILAANYGYPNNFAEVLPVVPEPSGYFLLPLGLAAGAISRHVGRRTVAPGVDHV